MREISVAETECIGAGVVPVVVIVGVKVGLDVLAGAGIGLGAGTLVGLWAAREILN